MAQKMFKQITTALNNFKKSKPRKGEEFYFQSYHIKPNAPFSIAAKLQVIHGSRKVQLIQRMKINKKNQSKGRPDIKLNRQRFKSKCLSYAQRIKERIEHKRKRSQENNMQIK